MIIAEMRLRAGSYISKHIKVKHIEFDGFTILFNQNWGSISNTSKLANYKLQFEYDLTLRDIKKIIRKRTIK